MLILIGGKIIKLLIPIRLFRLFSPSTLWGH